MGYIADKLFLAGFHLADAGQIVQGQQDAARAAFLEGRGNGAQVPPRLEHCHFALLPGLFPLALGHQAVDFVVADQFNEPRPFGLFRLNIQQFPGRRVQQQHPPARFGNNYSVSHSRQHCRQGVALIGKLLHRSPDGISHSVKGCGQFCGFVRGIGRRPVVPLPGRQLPRPSGNRLHRAGRAAQQPPAQGESQPAGRHSAQAQQQIDRQQVNPSRQPVQQNNQENRKGGQGNEGKGRPRKGNAPLQGTRQLHPSSR